MKKFCFIIISLVLLAACQEDVPVSYGEEAVISYNIETPVEFEIKSSTAPSKVNTLWYGVFHKKENGEYVYMEDMSAFVTIVDPSSIKVPVTLVKDQEYRIAFVAQHKTAADAYTYLIDGNGIMTYNAAVSHTSGDELDAFVFVDETGVIDGDFKKDVELTRKMSRVNLYTSSDKIPVSTKVAVAGAPASYDLFRAANSSATGPFVFEGLKPESGATHTNGGKTYNHVVSFYVFGGNAVSCDYTFTYADGTTQTLSVEGISTAPNYNTHIAGNF